MRKQVKVALKRPFKGHNVQVTEVVLQEPTANDYFALGSPQTWVRAAGGMALVDNDQAIRAYVERLIIEPDPVLALSQMSVIDAIAVKDAIVGFFQDEPTTSSDKSPTTSSLSSESSTQNPSAS